jgi:hypothetical protein
MQSTSTLDPRKIPVVTLTEDEIADARQQIALGALPPDFFELHKAAVARHVFGDDYKTDKHGHPIEQGIGSKGNETANHFQAIKKNEERGLELPGTYERMVAELWKSNPAYAEKLRLPKPLPSTR